MIVTNFVNFLLLFSVLVVVAGKLDLQIIHINDFHARFEPIDREFSSHCRPGKEETCIGGISRISSLAKGLLSTSKNIIFLNGGDNYEGSLWCTMYKWNVTAEFFRQFPFDAFVPGNHDFDDGVEGFASFLKTLPYPTVAANMDTSKEPSLAPYIKPSVVIKRGGKKIGIIGYDLQTFPQICNTGKLKFSDEATALNKESKRLKAKGVNILIALSHSGILKDIEVAKKAELVDIIVSAHSHTFMYTGKSPNPYDKPEYPYPLIIKQKSGRKVLIVQADAFSKYVGNLTVTFDDKGEVVSHAGNPILMDNKITTDVNMDKELDHWKQKVNKKGDVVMGTTLVELSNNGNCDREECSLGNFITDSMVFSYVKSTKHKSGWTEAAIAVTDSAGIPTAILQGNVTYTDVSDIVPFGSTIDAVSITGRTLIDVIEYSVYANHFLQWSGIEVTIDPKKPKGKIVRDLKVLCADCKVPKLEPVVLHKYYRVLLNTYLYEGGDGFTFFSKHGIHHTVGVLDIKAFISFLKRSSPVTTGIEGRINLIHPI